MGEGGCPTGIDERQRGNSHIIPMYSIRLVLSWDFVLTGWDGFVLT